MEVLTVRRLQDGTLARLSSLARQQGFDSREDFLRDIIERVAFEEFQFESEVRYQLLVSQYNPNAGMDSGTNWPRYRNLVVQPAEDRKQGVI
ncbi:hypothetical protein ACYSNU_18700 [Enterococcus sp. LJL120]